MKRAGKIAVWALLLGGCAGRSPYTVLYAPQPGGPGRAAPPVNLALGPSAEHGRLAEFFVGRSSWPAVPIGYRLDDTSYQVEVIYDDQSFYDRQGGGYFRTSESIRTGVLVR